MNPGLTAKQHADRANEIYAKNPDHFDFVSAISEDFCINELESSVIYELIKSAKEATQDKCQSKDTAASNYLPETPFLIADNDLVYNLRDDGIKAYGKERGQPVMVNDIEIRIVARKQSDEVKAEIAETICATLNEKYSVDPESKQSLPESSQ